MQIKCGAIQKNYTKIYCMKNNMPPCYLISLENHALSQKLSNECLESAKFYGWDINIWSGTNGYNVTKTTWENIKVRPLIDMYNMAKPGVQGCFMSHFNLWNKCIELNSEIIILEHDAIINSPWNVSLSSKNELIKLFLFRKKKRDRVDEYTGSWTPGLNAYLIHPTQAKLIINFCKTIGALPADVIIGKNIVNYKHLDYPLTIINKNMKRHFSTTNFL